MKDPVTTIKAFIVAAFSALQFFGVLDTDSAAFLEAHALELVAGIAAIVLWFANDSKELKKVVPGA